MRSHPRTLTWRLVLLALAACALAGCNQPNLGAPNGQFQGVWNSTFTDPTFGQVASQLIMQANGSFQKQDHGLQTGALITTYGNFQVYADQKLLRLNIDRGEPTETCGPLGCNPIIYPKGESYTYGFTDANTLQLHFFYCQPDQCNYTYKRQI
jgi:hypothetical protein